MQHWAADGRAWAVKHVAARLSCRREEAIVWSRRPWTPQCIRDKALHAEERRLCDSLEVRIRLRLRHSLATDADANPVRFALDRKRSWEDGIEPFCQLSREKCPVERHLSRRHAFSFSRSSSFTTFAFALPPVSRITWPT